MKALTPGQARALERIESFIAENGFSPTLDEIAERLGVSKPTVQQYLAALEEKGFIARERYAHRSIEVIAGRRGEKGARLPLLGAIAAGEPIDAIEERETVDVLEVLGIGKNRDIFLLRVKGDSMIEEGILDGDYAVVERRDVAENGDTVVALLPDNTATLKKFYREKGRIRLQPANPRMKPVYVKEVVIQGIVRGVLRPLG